MGWQVQGFTQTNLAVSWQAVGQGAGAAAEGGGTLLAPEVHPVLGQWGFFPSCSGLIDSVCTGSHLEASGGAAGLPKPPHSALPALH